MRAVNASAREAVPKADDEVPPAALFDFGAASPGVGPRGKNCDVVIASTRERKKQHKIKVRNLQMIDTCKAVYNLYENYDDGIFTL